MTYEVKNKVFFITGAATGIGAAAVWLLVAEGAKMDDYYLRTGVRVIAVCYGKTSTPLLENFHSFDDHIETTLKEGFDAFPGQSPESAARGLVDTYKEASSGSTWVATSNRPAEDVSADVKKGYSIMSSRVYT